MNNNLKPVGLLRSAAALLLAVLMVSLSLVGASADLHKLIHADAADSDHSCAVTLFEKGQVCSVNPVPALVDFVPQLIQVSPLETFTARPVFDVRLAPGRAPPSC